MIARTTMVVKSTEDFFQVKGQNRPMANLPVVDFHSQPRNANIKASAYITFGFFF